MQTIAKKSNNLTFMKKIMEKLSRIGAALMFPIAVLPVAAILLRIGAEIPTETYFAKFVNALFLKTGEQFLIIYIFYLPLVFLLLLQKISEEKQHLLDLSRLL